MNTTVTINKSKHNPSLITDIRTTFPFVHFSKKRLRFKVEFSDDCLYDTLEHSTDSNKLCGISFCNQFFKDVDGKSIIPHHFNSFRIAWVPVGGEIMLISYQYINGVRFMDEIGRCRIDKEYMVDCKIDYENKVIQVKFAAMFTYSESVNEFYFDYTSKNSYMLGHRFGGDNPAMQKIKYKFKRF